MVPPEKKRHRYWSGSGQVNSTGSDAARRPADRIELAMASDDASLVFMRAFLLAQRSKAPEIRIEHLLAALDEDMPSVVESSIRPEPPFLPVPHQDLPLSPGAAAALEPLGDIFDVSLRSLRSVLLDAQRRGAT